MLTEASLKLLATSALFLIIGMLLGNTILLAMGVLPVIFLALSLLLKQPGRLKVECLTENFDVPVDEVISLSFKVNTEGGSGPVTIGCRLPSEFKLVKGNNFKVLWKDKEDLEEVFNFNLQCSKRGIYSLEGLSWETWHPLQLTRTEIGKTLDQKTLVVRPYSFNVKKVRDKRAFSKIPIPTEARILSGIPTTDFKEIREYRYGDPYRSINWKATARLSKDQVPRVNEYEREGRRVVWIFLNTAGRMAVGTSIQNSLEYAIQAVLGLSDFYLSRQCVVGLSLFNDGLAAGEESLYYVHLKRILPDISPQKASEILEDKELVEMLEAKKLNSILMSNEMLLPDTGGLQRHKIMKKMIEVRLSGSYSSLREAVRRSRSYLLGTEPLFVVVTTVGEKSEESLLNGLRDMSMLTRGLRRKRPSIMLVQISGYDFFEQGIIATRLRDLENQRILNQAKGLGATVVNWNPNRGAFLTALLSQVKRS